MTVIHDGVDHLPHAFLVGFRAEGRFEIQLPDEDDTTPEVQP